VSDVPGRLEKRLDFGEMICRSVAASQEFSILGKTMAKMNCPR
jgi:hypothetical protein